MKNLFDFATKELSQDAFLRWLFENYNDSELKEAAGDLLKEFCGIDWNDIYEVCSTAQWCNIDISVWITLKDKSKIALFIEDKTYSNEHNQLDNYDNHIKWCEKEYGRIYKVFYKTDIVRDEERVRITGTKDKNKWRVYSINEILPLFEKYKYADNLILKQYAEHIINIYRATENELKPIKSDTHIDFLSWISYFERAVVPQLSEYKNICEFNIAKAGPYPYVYINFGKIGYHKTVPKLEIRSRDCYSMEADKRFPCKINIRFLCYGIPDADVPQQRMLIEKVKQGKYFETKGMVQRKNGKENYFPKQIGYLKDTVVVSQETFIQKIKEYIDYYIILMQEWR